ncbi:MAG: dethiobiotin synthase [Akkermansiaceae bacterium]|nr:dethiobiotin synthase [Akkermansiaceae bacterium]
MNYFITGTDTEIGKTHTTCALLRDLRARGLNAMGFKPLACGDRSDPRAMRAAVGDPTLSLDLINPIYLRAATAPYIAAELEQRPLQLTELTAAYHRLAEQYNPILVEGAGGWEAPLAPGLTMADLAAALALPVILVVANKLGAVNHTILTVQAIRARGLQCRAIILNHIGEEWDAASVTNRRLIEEFTGIPVQAELIHGQEDINSAAVLGE